jgi:hypothetical protein
MTSKDEEISLPGIGNEKPREKGKGQKQQVKKLCYIASLAGHALLLLFVLSARFPVTIRPEPPRVVTVTIAEPPLPYFNGGGVPAGAPAGMGSPAAAEVTGAVGGSARGARAETAPHRGAPSFAATGEFSLSKTVRGSFRLAPVGKSPDPWAIPIGPDAPPRMLRYSGNAFSPMASRSGPGGPGAPGSVFLLPFDIREKGAAEWTASVMARIERNWIIPASGRLAFSGQVQISLTIERQGGQRALAVDSASVPEPLILAALHAVQSSLPFPPLPENIAGEALAFTFVFAYNG